MREILFRGKAIKSNKWVFGDYVSDAVGISHKEYLNECGDIGDVLTYIIPETVGQYTGLTDKNDKKIFEGDIVKGKDNLERDLAVSGYIDHKNGSFVIVGDFMTHYRWLDYELEVVGNIHDNPELLKGGVEE